jgi:hypothetical protein
MRSDYARERVMAGSSVTAPRPRWRSLAAIATRIAYSVGGLFIFILALQLMKEGARGLKPILEGLSADGVLNLLGFGWLGSYIVMSGSPVAAISLSLYSSETISDTESFAMINGSRLGASFIVLFIGFVLWVTRKKSADGLYIGVVALLTAFALWIPVLPIGVLALQQGWFESVDVGTPGAVSSFVDVIYDPIVERTSDLLPDLGLFLVGVVMLLSAFWVFDRALPNLEQPSQRIERVKESLHHPLAMFVLGLLVTAITMSVSISLTLLIPLSLKGYIRRNAIIPYVMGANISTWIDTLLASLLLDAPGAFTIVFTEMVVGAAISLFVLIFLYKPFSAAVLHLANRITHNQRSFAAFMAVIFAVPLVLFLV